MRRGRWAQRAPRTHLLSPVPPLLAPLLEKPADTGRPDAGLADTFPSRACAVRPCRPGPLGAQLDSLLRFRRSCPASTLYRCGGLAQHRRRVRRAPQMMLQRRLQLALPVPHVGHPCVHVGRVLLRRLVPERALRLVRRTGPAATRGLTTEPTRHRCVQRLPTGRLAYQPGLTGAFRRVSGRPLAAKNLSKYVPIVLARAALPAQHRWRRCRFGTIMAG